MTSQQKRYRNFSSDSLRGEMLPSDDGYYQGMLKVGRKGTNMLEVKGIKLNRIS